MIQRAVTPPLLNVAAITIVPPLAPPPPLPPRARVPSGPNPPRIVPKSPGLPRDNARVRAARIQIWREVELGYRLLPNPILGVTGTNGKTTTVEWLGAMFRAAGREVAVAGNVGRALTGVDAAPDAWIVCELSSFQLEDVHEFRPSVAVLINLEPDHLDRHSTFEAYRDAKLRIFNRQAAEDTAVVPHGFAPVGGRALRVEF